MTAVSPWDFVGPRDTDADLVILARSGDQVAFADIYDRYADRLHDFCIGMLRDPDSAADCVQDAFYIAATRLDQLREPDRLRPWLYSIARNEALRTLRERRRETPSDTVPDTASDEPGPAAVAARTELADLIAEAAGGLSDRDQTVLELSYRHGLSGPELAEALQVSQTNAGTLVVRLRDTIERALGALLVARRVRAMPASCAELAAVLHGWDGHFTVLMRKRVARHIESCATCDDTRRQLVSPAALLGAAPLVIPAPKALREATLREIHLPQGGGKPAAGSPRGRRMLPLLFVAAALLAGVGIVVGIVGQKEPTVTPTDLTDTATPLPPTQSSLPTPLGPPTAAPGDGPPTKTSPVTTTTTTPAPTTPAGLPPVAPEPQAPAPTYEPPTVVEPTVEISTPPPPRATTHRRSTPSTPVTTERPTGIAGIPQTQAPTTKRRVINSPPPQRTRQTSPRGIG